MRLFEQACHEKPELTCAGVALAKTHAAGALHHIIVRGIERRKIFWDDEDRDSFFKRPELVGGGLIRSLGGWVGAKAARGGQDRIKGDERILGDGNFVKEVLESRRQQLGAFQKARHFATYGQPVGETGRKACKGKGA